MAPTGTYIEANGLRVYYEVYSEGEPLLLIHGGTATSESWASHLPAFTKHFQVFTPDSRGHGRTDNPTGELGYRVMANDVAASVGALGLQKPLVMGYSDGGQVALELGMRYPGLAKALVLGGAQFRFSEAYLEAVQALLGITDGEEVDTERLDRVGCLPARDARARLRLGVLEDVCTADRIAVADALALHFRGL
jgi:pimeloyl-ACP methyl ester carboxylesterase